MPLTLLSLPSTTFLSWHVKNVISGDIAVAGGDPPTCTHMGPMEIGMERGLQCRSPCSGAGRVGRLVNLKVPLPLSHPAVPAVQRRTGPVRGMGLRTMAMKDAPNDVNGGDGITAMMQTPEATPKTHVSVDESTLKVTLGKPKSGLETFSDRAQVRYCPSLVSARVRMLKEEGV
jgi:hypothetical protein